MEMPPIYIIDEIKVYLAKTRNKQRSDVSDAEVRIFMIRNPYEVERLLDKYAPKPEPEEPKPGWTAEKVKEALVLALEMLDQTEGRVGPAKLKAAGIEISDSWGYASDSTKTSPFTGSMTVSGMERILIGIGREPSWLNGELLSSHPLEREKLIAWAMCQISGPTVAQVCRKKKWARWTFYRQVNKAAEVIAQRLDRERVELF